MHENGPSATPQSASRATVPVTVIVPTLDEASQIADVIGTVAWADEVIVIDGGSSDGTAEAALAAGARVLTLRDDTIGAQRNLGLASARNEWTMVLDADQRAPADLREEVERAIRSPVAAAYEIRWRNFFMDRELAHGAYRNDWHIVLFRRDFRYTLDRVHERLDYAAGRARLTSTLFHFPFRDFRHYTEKVWRYARWGADDLAARGKRVTVVDVAGRPAWRFLRDYVAYRGFMDGLPGFLVAAFAGVGTLLKYSYRMTEQERSAEPKGPPRKLTPGRPPDSALPPPI